MKRRDFIKLLGGALGTVVLTSSCGGNGASGLAPAAPIPNGYRFFRLVSSGEPLPGGDTLAALAGAVMLNNLNEVYFYAMDESDTNGYYELLLDYDASVPKVLQKRKVVREGDTLGDSKVVTRIDMGDMNDSGNFAAVLQTDNMLSGLYLSRDKGGFAPVAGIGTTLPGGGGTFGGIFGDVDLHTGDDILLVAHFAPSDSAQSHQGVFHLAGGEVTQQGSLVTSTRDLIPDSSGLLTGIGLIDLHDGGNYVVQAYGSSPGLVQSARRAGTFDAAASSLLISGNVQTPSTMTLKSVAPALKSTRKGVALQNAAVGEIIYGARIGANGSTAYVLHAGGTRQVLHYSGRQVLAVGSTTPLGATVVSLSAPVIGSDGLLYYQAVTDQGLELIVYNGPETVTILATGDLIGDKRLKSFFAGFMPDQVDRCGRIVLTGDFEDGSSSVLVGIPV